MIQVANLHKQGKCTINGLKSTEEKEFIFNSEYAGRKVNIRIKINAINKSSETSNRISSS